MRNRETEPGVPIFSLKPCALKPCHSSKGLHLMVSSPPRRTPGWSLRFNTGDFWDRFKTQTTVQCEDLYTVSIWSYTGCRWRTSELFCSFLYLTVIYEVQCDVYTPPNVCIQYRLNKINICIILFHLFVMRLKIYSFRNFEIHTVLTIVILQHNGPPKLILIETLLYPRLTPPPPHCPSFWYTIHYPF